MSKLLLIRLFVICQHPTLWYPSDTIILFDKSMLLHDSIRSGSQEKRLYTDLLAAIALSRKISGIYELKLLSLLF